MSTVSNFDVTAVIIFKNFILLHTQRVKNDNKNKVYNVR